MIYKSDKPIFFFIMEHRKLMKCLNCDIVLKTAYFELDGSIVSQKAGMGQKKARNIRAAAKKLLEQNFATNLVN